MNTMKSKKLKKAALARWSTKRFRDKMKKITSSVAYRRKMSQSVSKAFSSLKRRKARSLMTKSLWKRKSYRRKVIEAVTKSKQSEETIKKTRKSLRKSWTLKRRQALSLRMRNEWVINKRERTQKNRFVRAKLANRCVMTRSERWFDELNSSNGFGFRFTGAEKNIAGSRTPDFVDEKNNLAIEIYGNQHKNTIADDQSRIKEIKTAGWKVLIIWNDELRFEKSKVIAKVNRFVDRYR